ncbi:MAG TPA: hypothetical protein VLU91_08985 [Nitrososphaerales archaeon]|nr:hypothetical protein [Nitrososphaerales archaeon]
MRQETKVLAVLFGGGFIATSESLSRLIAIPQDLSRLYWVLPFSIALASLIGLTVSLALGRAHVRKIPAALLPALYLSSCLSVAFLSLPSSLVPGFAPPTLVVFAAQGLLLTSAWAHFRSLEYTDEEPEAPPSASEWFEI